MSVDSSGAGRAASTEATSLVNWTGSSLTVSSPWSSRVATSKSSTMWAISVDWSWISRYQFLTFLVVHAFPTRIKEGGVANDSSERCPQLMAHARQEFVLRLPRPL